MRKFRKILCAVLIIVAALFACGCGKLAQIDSEPSDVPSRSEGISSVLESNSSVSEESSVSESNSSVSEESSENESSSDTEESPPANIDKNGKYTKKDDVALYIHTYKKLPSNFITKKEAQKLGWTGGSLEKYAPGMCIGGDRFGNYEGLLPSKSGRQYTECDIDTLGKSSRGTKRIVFSNDGLVYYTGDHYKTFTLLYGKE